MMGIQLTMHFHSESEVYSGYVFYLAKISTDDNTVAILMKVWQQLGIADHNERFGLDDVRIY